MGKDLPTHSLKKFSFVGAVSPQSDKRVHFTLLTLQTSQAMHFDHLDLGSLP